MNNGHQNFQVQMTVSLTPAVKAILILQSVVWLAAVVILQGMVFKNNNLFVFDHFGLSAQGVLSEFKVWQPITYMFIHSPEVWHLLFNSLIIWFIGSELEKIWGFRDFIKYYLICGLGAGLIYIACMFLGVSFLGLNPGYLSVPTVGASGAVFGLLVAYGVLFGERMIYFMMLFPMKAKYFVIILGAVEVFTVITSGVGGKVNNLAHLGGFLVGFCYLQLGKYKQKRLQNKWLKKRGRNLKLVVDNEPDKPKGPTYH